MQHETLITLDRVPETLYELHQQVWSMLSCSSGDKRDFLFAFDRSCGELYVRTARVREQYGPWRAIDSLVEGCRYTVAGTLAIDATRTCVLGQEALGWRHPVVLERRVRPMLERFLQVHSLAIRLGTTETLGKGGGHENVRFTPVHVLAEGVVSDANAANAALERGVGRAKSFGFGVLHFTRGGLS